MTWGNRLVFERGGFFYSSKITLVFPTFNL